VALVDWMLAPMLLLSFGAIFALVVSASCERSVASVSVVSLFLKYVCGHV
jgi:hypothetical protein